MRERSDINELFRTRLEHAEMDVRDGFWEALEHDLQTASAPVAGKSPRKLVAHTRRWAVAASVLVLLGMASWLLWVVRPDEQVLPQPLVELDGPLAPETAPALADAAPHPSASVQEPSNKGCKESGRKAEPAYAHTAGEQPISVHVSITIRQRQYGARPQRESVAYHAAGQHSGGGESSRWDGDGNEAQRHASQPVSVEECGALLKRRNWALKASLGTSLPAGSHRAPLTADVSVERRLTRHLSLEAGVQYNRLTDSEGETLHTLGIPVRLNVLLAQGTKFDFYAQLGGMVEKCVAGVSDNSFRAEPVQGSVGAGLGVRYKLTDRLALFAEPSVSHHFDTDSSARTLRTERPVNVNLLCGLRMTY